MEYSGIIDYMIALLSCFATNCVLKEMFGWKEKNTNRMALSLIAYFFLVMDAIVSKYSHVIFPFMVFLGMIVLMVNYNESLKKGLPRILKVHLVAISLYIIVLMIVSPLGAGNEVFIIFTFIHYVTLKVYDRILNSSYKESSILYLILPATFIGMIIYILYGVELTNYQRMMVLFCIVVVSILIIVFYGDFVKQYEGTAEKRILEEQNHSYEQQMELIERNEKAISRVRHDMKNHIIVIRQMLKSGLYDKLEKYIDKIEESSLINVDFQDTGNFEFDAILSSKIGYIQSKGIHVEKQVLIPEGLQIEGFDISIIIGNLLDNAMRAVQDLEEEFRWIKFVAVYNRNVLCITVSNPYKGSIRFDQNHMPETTKSAKKVHGIGLKSVKSAVEKYNGSLELSAEANIFKAEVIMFCEAGS